MEHDGEHFSGYDLAERIFVEAHEDPVSAYIDLVGDETSWLEFKAGMYAREEDREDPRENEEDNFWHISKAILAMLNSSGGVVVIGVQDQTFQPVDLAADDPKHVLEEQGLDAYVRLVVEKNLPPDRKAWSTGCSGPWMIDTPIPSGHICFERATYKDRLVVLVFVKPFNDCRTTRHGNKEVMLVRRPGARGRVDELTTYEQFRDWEKQRIIRHEKFDALYEQFHKRQEALAFEQALNAKIQDYYESLSRRARDEMAVFTPLDAEENVFEAKNVDSFYSPEAVEWKESSSSWLNNDSDDDEEGENGYDIAESESDEDEEINNRQSFDDEDLDSDNDASIRRGDLLTLLDETPRAIVSGEPGGGKTTCLTYFALRFQKLPVEQKTLAVFIPMGQWLHGGSLLAMVLSASGLDLPQLESLLSSNRIRLVIDAVNECPDQFRAAAILNLQQFLATHPSTPVVLSTRHPEELSSLELPVFHVQPMDDEHRRKYLERYLGDPELAERLLSQLRKMPGGDTLAENPMLLRLVVEVYRESPSKRLPPGRAGLYRRSLRSWYKREKGKREDSREPLPFTYQESRAFLAELAFKSRMKGFRSSVREEALASIWGDSSSTIISSICQGPVVYRDADFIRFRHETFQEYLAAEYLESHPNEIPSWTTEDYSLWGMPFAYLIELLENDGKGFSHSIWSASWRLNPWLGIALTQPTKEQYKSPQEHYQKENDAFETIHLANEIDEKFFSGVVQSRLSIYAFQKRLKEAAHNNHAAWYSRRDAVLTYVVTVSKQCFNNWRSFELLQTQRLGGLWVQNAIVCANNWIVLKNPRTIFRLNVLSNWKQWILEAHPYRVVQLIESGIAEAEDFSQIKNTWGDRLTFNVALDLCRLNALSSTDIADRVSDWIEHADIPTARKMIDSGMIQLSDISDKVSKWKSSGSPVMAAELIDNQLATREEFSELKNHCVHNPDPCAAKWLTSCRLASREDFLKPIENWIELASPDIACAMVQCGLALPEQFKRLLPKWIAQSQYSFVRHYLIKFGDEEDQKLVLGQVERWIRNATPQSAALLLDDGLAKYEDFSCRRKNWLAFSFSPSLLDHGLVSESEYELTKRADLLTESAQKRFKNDEIKEEDMLKVLVNQSRFVTIQCLSSIRKIIPEELIRCRISSLLDNITLEEMYSLVKFKLVKSMVFDSFLATWNEMPAPGMVLALLNEGVLKNTYSFTTKDWCGLTRNTNETWCAFQFGCMSETNALETCSLFDAFSPGKHDETHGWANIRKRKILIQLQKGKICSGTVKNITDFGAFVQLDNGIDGLIHISDLSWERVKNPADFLQSGQQVSVVILDIDPIRLRVALGLKQAQHNPWDDADKKYPVGSRVQGKVVKLAPYGAFVELEPGIEGLVHVSEFSWTRKVVRASDELQIDDEVTVVVLSIDKENQKLALGIRQTEKNPWEGIEKRYLVGMHVKGKILNFAEYGAFVQIEDDIVGMIHVFDMSWTRKINHPTEFLQKGQEVEAMVLAVDSANQRISLGLKQMHPDPRRDINSRFSVGQLVKGRVYRIRSLRAFVDLEDGVDGFVDVSQISERPVGKVKDVLKIGQEIEARIIMIDCKEKRIALSMKAVGRGTIQETRRSSAIRC